MGGAFPMIPPQPLLNLLPYIIAVAFPLALGLFIGLRNRAPVGACFSLMLLEQGLWSAAVLLEILAPTIRGKILWDDLQFLTSGVAAVLTYSFSLRYMGKWYRGGWRTWWLLMLFPLISWALAATNDFHGLHRVGARIDASVPFGELVYTFRPAMLLSLAPVYTLAVGAVVRLAVFAGRQGGSRRMGAIAACAGLALPIVGTIGTIAGIRINGRLDASSLWLTAGDVLVAVGILRYRMAGVIPVARKRIVENLRDPVLVIDHDGRIVDFNDAIEGLFGADFRLLRGEPARQALSLRMPTALGVLEGQSHEAEVTVHRAGLELDYSLRTFPVIRDEKALILVFRDITALKSGEKALRSLSVELEHKVEERVLELEAEVRHRRSTEERLTELNDEMVKTRKEIMFTLSEVVENRGLETASHVARVSEYCRVLGRAYGLSQAEAEMLANASAMHDIGKIGIPDAVLLSAGDLDAGDLDLMRSHTRIGHEILAKSDEPLIQMAARIALEHHESWDGSGYPEGKRGQAIGLQARIVTVCDVFDSLSASRPYRAGWGLDRILGHFRTERGRLFDPALVDLLFANLDAFLDITERYPDDPEAFLNAESGGPA